MLVKALHETNSPDIVTTFSVWNCGRSIEGSFSQEKKQSAIFVTSAVFKLGIKRVSRFKQELNICSMSVSFGVLKDVKSKLVNE